MIFRKIEWINSVSVDPSTEQPRLKADPRPGKNERTFMNLELRDRWELASACPEFHINKKVPEILIVY